jgi:ATP-dependent Lon protease
MKRVVLPKRNHPDLKDIPEETLRDLEIVFVERIDELLQHTLSPASEAAPEKIPSEAEPVTTSSEVGFEGGEARA